MTWGARSHLLRPGNRLQPFTSGEHALMPVAKSLRILIADNDTAYRNALGRLLTKAGHQVHTAAGGPAAIWASLEKGGFDLALVDWSLASAKDFVLLRKMAAHPSTSRVAGVVTVAEADAAEAAKARGRLSCPLLAKSSSPQELTQAIKQALGGQRKAGATGSPQGEEEAALFAAALEKLKTKDFSGALLGFSKALKTRKVFPEACKGLGMACAGLGQRERALHFFRKAVEQYRGQDRKESAHKLEQYLLQAFPEAAGAVSPPEPDHAPDPAAVPGGDGAAAHETARETAHETAMEDDTLTTLATGLGLPEDGGADSLNLEVGGEEWYGRISEEAKEETETILGEEEADAAGRENRAHPRLTLVENFVRLARRKELHPAVNISLGGIGFKDQGLAFEPGEALTFDLLGIGSEVLMKKATAQVRHVSKGLVGCRFADLSPRNRKALEKLVG